MKSIGILDYPNYLSQEDDLDCVKAMMTIPPDEIMGRVHIADPSDRAHEMKGIDACNYYGGYNHVLDIAQPVNGSPASH